MENSINTYRIRYLKDTSLQTAYVQGKGEEEATKEFLKIFTNIQSEKILSVVNIQENQREFDISKIVKIATSVFIALIGVYGIYLGWNSYKQMSSNEDAKHTYSSYTKKEKINTFSSKKRSDPKSERRKDLGNSNSYSSEGQKDQLRSKDYQKEFKDAIKKDDISAVQKILKKKVPTSVIENSGTMGWICLAASEEISTLFLKYGVSPNAECYTRTHIKLPWLVLAVRDNRLDLVKQLLLHGASVYVLDNNGRNLLELASSNEMRNILKQNMSKEKAKEFHKTINYKESLNLKIKNKEYKSNKCIKSKQNKEVCSEIGLVYQVVNNSRDRAVMININNAISRVVNFYKKEGIPNPDFASNVSLSLNIKLKEVSPKQFTIAVIGNRFYWRTIVIDEAYIFSTSTGEKIGGDHLDKDEIRTKKSQDVPVLSKKQDSDLKDGSMVALDKSIRTLKGHNKAVESVAFSPDGTKIASGSHDSTIKLWDVQSGKLLNTFKGGKDGVESVAFSPDGTMIASGSYDWTIKLWDAQSGTLVSVIEDEGSAINDIAFSPDGIMIVSVGEYGVIKLWDVETGRLLKKLGVNGMPINSVAFSPDGTMIATGGGEDSTIRLWDIQSGKQIRTLKGHYYGLAFSPDGNQIASGDGKAIKLWDTQSGRLLNTLKGHKDVARCIAFSPDGTTIVSGGSNDDTIKLWNAKSGRLLDVFEGHRGSVNSVAFSPNGAKIVSGSYDKTIKLWDIRSQPAISERQELEQLRAEKAAQEREAAIKSMKNSTTIPQNTRADAHMDGSETYYAKISQRDHYGKNGQKLKGAGIILQQDRANYHKYHKRDREDTGDNRFDTRDNRNKIKRMLARGSTSQETLDAIRYGTPLVKVKIYPEYIDVTLESGGDQIQQMQQKKNSAQPRQNKSKKSKCNTDGSIRGISSRGDGFVAVRKGPGTKYGMVGKIYRNGTRVKICDRKGKWKGVIYGDCISGSSRSRNGSCKAGWVYEKYIRIR